MSGTLLLADPTTREPLGLIPSREGELRRRAVPHWPNEDGDWLTGMDYEDGIPVRMWFRPCDLPCHAEVTQ